LDRQHVTVKFIDRCLSQSS